MNKKWMIALALVCIATLASWWVLERSKRADRGEAEFMYEAEEGADGYEEDTAGEEADLSDSETEEEARRLLKEMPGFEQMEEEYRKNPEATPLSIIQFAESMAPKMEEALQSETKAAEFFDELSECARKPGENENFTLRAICLANAGRLAETYPEKLEDRFTSLLKEMPEKVQLLVRSFLQ